MWRARRARAPRQSSFTFSVRGGIAIFRLDRLRLRGWSSVKDEVLLTATAQNLRRPAHVPAKWDPVRR